MGKSNQVQALKTRTLNAIEYGLAVMVGSLLRAMPVDFASAFMGRIWRVIAPLTKRQARVIEHLRAAFPDKTDQELNHLSRQMWDSIGRTAAESFHIGKLLSDPSRFRIPDADVARAPFRTGEGLILVSMHCGNWELVGPIAAVKGIPITAVYQPLRNPLVETYLLNMRRPFFPGGLFPKGHQMAREFLKTVREKTPVAMVADQRDLRGVEVTFFGQTATATPFPAVLARAGEAPIVVGMVRRMPGPRLTYEVPLRRIDMPSTGDKSADIQQSIQDIHTVFEEWIRETPEQYMWAHQKWRRSETVKRRGSLRQHG